MDRIVLVAVTREQEPYSFDPERVELVRRALPAGDYSVGGWETAVAVERKSLEDLVSTVIRHRSRFRRELRLMENYECACVVVEAPLRDVLEGRYRSAAHPNAVFGSVLSIVVDYRIPVFFCGDRQAACRFVEGFLLRFHTKVNERCKEQPPGPT